MKRPLVTLLSLALGAALLCGAAMAQEPTVRRLGPVRVWGTATRLESGSLYLQNSNESDPNREIIVHIGEETAVVDAVSGLPMDPADIRDGDAVYAWVGPAMTRSLPPQATAAVVVANIPADFGAPQYYEVSGVKPQPMAAIYPPPPLTHVELVTADGRELTITDQAQLTPWRTRNLVRLENLIPGSRILVWTDMGGAISRVVVFPCDYRGYITWEETGEAAVNGAALPVSGRTVDGKVLLPLRFTAEAAGYDVEWAAGTGAVVSQAGETVLTAMPGGTVCLNGETAVEAVCVLDQGVTYLEAEILVRALALYPAV